MGHGDFAEIIVDECEPAAFEVGSVFARAQKAGGVAKPLNRGNAGLTAGRNAIPTFAAQAEPP